MKIAWRYNWQIRSRKWKTDGQYNDQKKKYKKTINDPQSITHSTKHRGEHRFSGREKDPAPLVVLVVLLFLQIRWEEKRTGLGLHFYFPLLCPISYFTFAFPYYQVHIISCFTFAFPYYQVHIISCFTFAFPYYLVHPILCFTFLVLSCVHHVYVCVVIYMTGAKHKEEDPDQLETLSSTPSIL